MVLNTAAVGRDICTLLTFIGAFRLYRLGAQLEPGTEAGMQTGHAWWAWPPCGLQVYLETFLSCKETCEHVSMVMLLATATVEDQTRTWRGTLGV